MAASEAANIQRTRDVLTATFKSEVFFDFDSASLKPGGYAEIGRVSGVLNKYPQTTIRVEGHTDSIGGEEYNLRLSERRARSVVEFLEGQQIDAVRLAAEGYGMTQPVADNATAQGRSRNRRVELVIGDRS